MAEQSDCVMKPQLLIGNVWHRRLRPAENAFVYPVIQLSVPVHAIGELKRTWLSVDRFNLFSFHSSDHGDRDGSSLSDWIQQLLVRHGFPEVNGEIRLQTMPRILGYVFNPISFWYCHDQDGSLRVVVCEVNNTFGGTHCYLIAHPDRRPITDGDWFDSRKQLHVSPFCSVGGYYRFQFKTGEAESRVKIDYHDHSGLLLQTSITTHPDTLSSRALLRVFFAFPWNTLATFLRIHYQAFRLWRKGVTFYGKEPPSPQPESHT